MTPRTRRKLRSLMREGRPRTSQQAPRRMRRFMLRLSRAIDRVARNVERTLGALARSALYLDVGDGR